MSCNRWLPSTSAGMLLAACLAAPAMARPSAATASLASPDVTGLDRPAVDHWRSTPVSVTAPMDGDVYRRQAVRFRHIAEQTQDPAMAQAMLGLAVAYEARALQIEAAGR